MTARRLSPLSLSAFLCSSVGLWASCGTLGVAGTEPGAPRLGVLPSFWWLGAAVAVSALLLLLLRPVPKRVAVLWLSLLLMLPWLPWLPQPIASAALIFTGHLRAFVWIGIAIGLVAPVAIAAVRASPIVSDPRRAPWAAATLAALVYLGAATSIWPRRPAGDEPHYLVIAQSLLRDHDLQIENNHTRGDYHEFFAPELKPDYLRRGVNGQIYSIHAPGLPAVIAPVFAFFGYAGVVVMLALLNATATGLAWIATWRLTGRADASWFGWATVALTVPFVFEAFTVFPDGLGGSIVMAGVLTMLAGAGASARALACTGAALALLPWLHTRFALPAGALGLMIAARQHASVDRGRRIAAFLGVPVVAGLAWFWFFYAIYGTPNPAAPYGDYTQSSPANVPRGLTGLLLDQQFGILPYAPVYLSALIGFVPLVRRAPRVAGELALIALPYAVATAAYFMWWGGFSAPGRFLTPVLLPLSIPAGVWFASAGAAERLLGCGGLLVSVLITATLGAVDHGRLVSNLRDGASLFLLWLAPLVNLSAALPSLFQGSPLTAWLRGAAWLTGIAATAAVGTVLASRRAAPSAIGLGLGLAASVFGTAAVAGIWYVAEPQPVAAARQGPILLRAIDPAVQQVAVRFNPLQRLRISDVPRLVPIGVPGRAAADPLLSVAEPPAGTYVIEAVLDGTAGRLTAGLDREPGPLWSWDLTGTRGPWRQSIVLPVPSVALQIDGDASARRAVSSLSIRGERLASGPARLTGFDARRAAHYGPATVFLVRGSVFMERAGAWVAGRNEAEFVVFPDSGATVRLLLRNFAVDNTVTFESAAGPQEYRLKPREERTVDVPVDAGTRAAIVRVKSAGGARPSDLEPGNLDARLLGCWLETR
jgi:hypothetical protein